MGHVRLGVLPKTRKWEQVVDELRYGADVGAVAASVAEAAETALRKASQDPAFLHVFWLLTQVPLAPMAHARALVRQVVLEELLTGEVLEIRVMHPALAHPLVRRKHPVSTASI